jgi:ribosome-associated protein
LRAKPEVAVAEATPTYLIALRAAESKKAHDVKLIDLRSVTSFADYFLIISGTNQRQNQAIWDEIVRQMRENAGEKPINVEGYENADWILGDYGDLIVHVFSEQTRTYYDLERLWRHAKDVPLPKSAA